MEVREVLRRHGGVTSRGVLLRWTSREALGRAVASGEVVRDARGRYALPSTQESLRRANALTAVASHRSAAALWGWEQKLAPPKPEVTVPRNRKVPEHVQASTTVHWARLAPEEVHRGLVTSRSRTLTDCLRSLPFDEALAIADSALRHGDVGADGLRALAAGLRGPGAGAAREVADFADGRADNPFESVLRAQAREVPGLRMRPQVPVRLPATGTAYVDLADDRLRIVAEADSFAFHGDRTAFWRDCRRYNRLSLLGWLVLRFAWEDVMFHPDYVRECLGAAVAHQRAQPRSRQRKAAGTGVVPVGLRQLSSRPG